MLIEKDCLKEEKTMTTTTANSIERSNINIASEMLAVSCRIAMTHNSFHFGFSPLLCHHLTAVFFFLFMNIYCLGEKEAFALIKHRRRHPRHSPS